MTDKDAETRTADGPDYPAGAAQDPTLSRDAEHSTYSPAPVLDPDEVPPRGTATVQELGAPAGGGAAQSRSSSEKAKDS